MKLITPEVFEKDNLYSQRYKGIDFLVKRSDENVRNLVETVVGNHVLDPIYHQYRKKR